MKQLWLICVCCSMFSAATTALMAQGKQPYASAATDRLFRAKTPMAPPPVNTLFADPDFGSSMIRVTDQNTNPKLVGSYYYNSGTETNSWSADGRKFYITSQNAINLAFGFDPSTMAISSLPPAPAGQGLRLPFRSDATFSFLDSDLMYGLPYTAPFKISKYRFSSGKVTPLVDLTKCGTQPPIVPTGKMSADAVKISADDSRMVTAGGGKQFGGNPLVLVYDKSLGCRWYNTQTGAIGGAWGQTGTVAMLDRFPVRHAAISGSGKYVKISVDGPIGFYIWDVATLNVAVCPKIAGAPGCTTYGAMGYNSWVAAAGSGDEMNTLKWPLGNLPGATSLLSPLPLPHYWGMERHFSWRNGQVNDNVPVCGTTYSYDGDPNVTQPYDGEVVCTEADGLGSTIWRFAHNRAVWNPTYFYTDTFGNLSLDGNFLMFSSTWDGQTGVSPTGGPRSDVWIVKLN